MKQYFLIFLLSLVSVSCTNNKATPPTSTKINETSLKDITLPLISDCGYQVSDKHAHGWELVFKDDFNDHYNQDWNAWTGGAYNQELQHYQEDNIKIENGLLHILAKREQVKGHTLPNDKKVKTFEFTSGRLESKKLYGPKNVEGSKTIKFSARLRLVEGEGMWPAWWSYGKPWPTVGEIDILEARGHTPRAFSSCFHYGEKPSIPDTEPALNEFHFEYPEKLTDCFHVYEMEWTEDSFKIFFDEELVKIYDSENYPYVRSFWEKEHMLCLNLAVGGNFFKTVDETKIPDEAFYVVDWVKIYRR